MSRRTSRLSVPVVVASALALAACGSELDASLTPLDSDSQAMANKGPTIAEIASGAEDFSILVSLLADTGLASTFDGNRQFTVFAPTNAAFEALFEVVDPASLTEEQIVSVLLYHVAPGERFSGDVLDSERIRTLNGEFLWVDAEDLAINDSNLILPLVDIDASNGVIHAIDTVLLPPNL